jgi:hypothetical protein
MKSAVRSGLPVCSAALRADQAANRSKSHGFALAAMIISGLSLTMPASAQLQKTYSVCQLSEQHSLLDGRDVRVRAQFTTDLNHFENK